MKLKKIIFSLMVLGTCVSAYANNFDYCYSKEKGLDEECYARKEANTKIYRDIKNSSSVTSSTYSEYYGGPYGYPRHPHQYDENGRFVPTPIPQRMPYILPGMY